MYGFSLENDRFHKSLGKRDLAESQKCHLKLTSVWKAKSKMYEFPQENARFHLTLGTADLAESQK